jgi:hypothetical protein
LREAGFLADPAHVCSGNDETTGSGILESAVLLPLALDISFGRGANLLPIHVVFAVFNLGVRENTIDESILS